MPAPSTTVVIGAGHAGLAVSRELQRAGVDHVVLERGRIGQRWRTRWESFCLVTPNWTVQLPDGHYDGDDPDGFMERDEIVAFLERYARGLRAPVHEGVEVSSLTPAPRVASASRPRTASCWPAPSSSAAAPTSGRTARRWRMRCRRA